jgi:hypothetical protein
LKKRTKNEKGAELLFLDPLDGAIGEVSRANCLSSQFIKIKIGDGDKETLEGAVADVSKLDDVIQTVRKSLKVNLKEEEK